MTRLIQNSFLKTAGLLLTLLAGNLWAQTPVGTPISNTAYASYETGPGVEVSVPSDTVVTVVSESEIDLSVTKSVNEEQVSLGDTVIYTILVTNNSIGSATNVVIRDTLAQALSYLSSNPIVSVSGNVVEWIIPQIQGGESINLELACEVIRSPFQNTIENIVSYEVPGFSPRKYSNNTTVELQPYPMGNLSKTVLEQAAHIGDTLTYNLRINNTGPDALTKILVTDTLPAGTEFLTATDRINILDGILSWRPVDLQPGQEMNLEFKARILPSASGTLLKNTAYFSSAEGAFDTSSVETEFRGSGIGISKQVDLTSAYVGDTLTYTLTLSNSGLTKRSGIVVTDTLPQGVDYITASDRINLDDRVLTWRPEDLPPGQQLNLTFKVNVLPTVSSDTLTNIVHLNTAEGEQDTSLVKTKFLGHGLGLHLNKQAPDSVVSAGDTLTYALILSNSGIRTAHTLLVRDTLSDHLDYISSFPTATVQNNIVTWNLAELANGHTDTLQVTTAIRTPIQDNTRVDNVAWVSSYEGAADSSSWSIRVISAAKAEFEKQVDKQSCYAGDTLTYTLRVQNLGLSMLNNIQVVDSLPPGVDYLTATAQVNLENGVLTWRPAALQPTEEALLDIRVRVLNNVPGDSLINTAILNTAEGIKDTSHVSTGFLGHGVGLEIIKQAADSVYWAGDTLSYDLILSNSGAKIGHNIVVRDTLSDHLEFVEATHSGTEQGNIVTWNFSNLGSGFYDTLRVTTVIQTPIEDNTHIDNVVWASSSEGAQDSSEWSVRVMSKPIVSLIKSADRATVFPGDTLTYTLLVNNTGSASLSTAQVVDTLPTGIEYISASEQVTVTNGIVIWPVGTVEAGQSKVLDLKTEVGTSTSGDSLVNTAYLTADGGRTDTASVKTALSEFGAGIEVLKLTPDSVYAAGDSITYSIIVRNNTDNPADNVSVTDTLSSHLTFIKATNDGVFETRSVVWTLGTLQPGHVDTLDLVASINIPIDNNTHIPNIAWAVSSNAGRDSSLNTIRVTSAAILNLDKISDQQAMPGDTLTYTLTCANTGTAPSYETVLIDSLPSNLEFIDASGSFVYDENNHVVTWSQSTIQPGQIDTMTLVSRVTDTTPLETEIVNTAWLGNQRFDAQTQSMHMTRIELTQPENYLFAYKTVDKAIATVGDTVVYQIHYGSNWKEQPKQAKQDTIHIIDYMPREMRWIQDGFLAKPHVQFKTFDPVTNEITFQIAGLTTSEADSIELIAIVISELNPGVKTVENTALIFTSSDSVSTEDDPRSNATTKLFKDFLKVKKQVNRKVAELGDLLTYTVTIENKSLETPVYPIQVTDILPSGFRYILETTRFDSILVADPDLSETGQSLRMLWTFMDTLQPGARKELRYRIVAGLSAEFGENINRVFATAWTEDGMEVYSPEATAAVLIRTGVLDEKGLIIGKVFVDRNWNGLHDGGEPGLKNVELIMEDGTRVLTDDFGKYSIPNVETGQHVIRVNEKTLPNDVQLVITSHHFMGDSISRLVLLSPGNMAKANFITREVIRLTDAETETQ